MHDINIPKHVPYLDRGALGHLPGRRFIPPHTVLPGQPAQAEGECP